MKLRYIREQRDQARLMQEGGRLNTKSSKKRTKFQLDSDDSDGGDNDVFMGLLTKAES